MRQARDQHRSQIVGQLRSTLAQHKETLGTLSHEFENAKEEAKSLELSLNNFARQLAEAEQEQSDDAAMFYNSSDPNQPKIVLIGNTGHGKSTLANRLCGDTSRRGNEGQFTAERGLESVTSSISWGTTTSGVQVVDTPGLDDSNGYDEFHANALAAFLRQAKAVETFVLVRNAKKHRLDEADQNRLSFVETLLGREFWKISAIVFSRIDDDEDEKDFPEIAKEFVQTLRAKYSLPESEFRLPATFIGRQNFQTQSACILDLCNSFDGTSFSSATVESPLDRLKIDIAVISDKLTQAKQRVENLQTRTTQTENEITTLEEQIRDKTELIQINLTSSMVGWQSGQFLLDQTVVEVIEFLDGQCRMVPPMKCVLMHEGRPMAENSTLKECGVHRGSLISAAYRRL